MFTGLPGFIQQRRHFAARDVADRPTHVTIMLERELDRCRRIERTRIILIEREDSRRISDLSGPSIPNQERTRGNSRMEANAK